MRAYTVAVAALALGVDTKWVDNVLSHHEVAGVEKKKQGIQRQIPPDALLTLAVARQLIQQLQLPIGKAISIAEEIRRSPHATANAPRISISMDVGAIIADLNDGLRDAVEGAAQRRRGRPTIR